MDALHYTSPKWKHTTATHHQGCDSYDGIALFDDEQRGYFSIYVRFKDGTLFPARTVAKAKKKHAQSVLNAWVTDKGKVFDYRQDKTPAVNYGTTVVAGAC